MRTDKGIGRPLLNRGHDLPNGISYQCKIGRHGDCSAMRCKCECLHGSVDVVTARTRDVIRPVR